MSEIKKTAEQVSFELISHAGNSKSCSMEAMAAADQRIEHTEDAQVLSSKQQSDRKSCGGINVG